MTCLSDGLLALHPGAQTIFYVAFQLAGQCICLAKERTWLLCCVASVAIENLHTHHLQVTTAAFAAGPCVINVYINYERKFAFVELRTGEPSLIWLPQKGSQDMYLEEVFVLVSAHQKCTASGVMYSIQCNSHAGHTMLMPMHDLDASNVGQQQS